MEAQNNKMAVPNKIMRLRERLETKTDRREEKKQQLALCAIKAMSQVGYANTSLRDIAELSGVSVGVIHYYFEDKVDLITYCVHTYKVDFISRIDAIMQSSPSQDSLVADFIDGVAQTMRDDGDTHRLWYDIRGQAMFDERYRPAVAEIELALISLVERLLVRLQLPTDLAVDVYLSFDGQFRYYLQRHLAGDRKAIEGFSSAMYRAFAIIGQAAPCVDTSEVTIHGPREASGRKGRPKKTGLSRART